MKDKIKPWCIRLTEALRSAPVETLLAFYAFVICALIREDVIVKQADYACLLPLFFMASFLLNRLCRLPRVRVLYYASVLFVLPFWWVDLSVWTESAAYPVSLIVGLLAVIASDWMMDNKSFVNRLLRYVYDLLVVLVLVSLACLAVMAVFHSIVYIFNLFKEVTPDVKAYIVMILYVLIAPLCFLTFNRESERKKGVSPDSVFDRLLNYVLSPAVLIYTLVLYLYFITLILDWTLPKGGIAYLVFAYTMVAFLVKACQLLLKRHVYDWYYNRFSLIALPALLMFWVGVGYRINEYGFTQSRVYLVICGVVMTFTVLLFLKQKWGRYLYVTLFSAILLSFVTYIPGITGAAIAIRSQVHRADQVINRLDLADSSGKLLLQRRPETDTIYTKDYKKLFESLTYLQRECGDAFLMSHYGIPDLTTWYEKVLPSGVARSIDEPYYDAEISNKAYAAGEKVLLISDEVPIPIAGYKAYYEVTSYDDGLHLYALRSRDTLTLRNGSDRVLFRQSLSAMLQEQLATVGAVPSDTLSQTQLDGFRESLLIYERDTIKVIFDRMTLVRLPVLKIIDLEVKAYLTR